MNLECTFDRSSFVEHRDRSGLATCCLARAPTAEILEQHAERLSHYRVHKPVVRRAGPQASQIHDSETFKQRLKITLRQRLSLSQLAVDLNLWRLCSLRCPILIAFLRLSTLGGLASNWFNNCTDKRI
jgi:hypothetical protein